MEIGNDENGQEESTLVCFDFSNILNFIMGLPVLQMQKECLCMRTHSEACESQTHLAHSATAFE